MEKFTKIEKIPKPEIVEPTNKFVNVTTYKDYEFVLEKDIVAVIPYFVDEGLIYMRSEYNPAFQYGYKKDPRFQKIDNFLTVITGKISEMESPINTIRRNLFEEAGIVLNSLYKIDTEAPLFLNKTNSSRIYISILELRYNDYRQTAPKTDGTEFEKKSSTLKIDLKYIDDIIPHDIITELLLLKLKNIMKLK